MADEAPVVTLRFRIETPHGQPIRGATLILRRAGQAQAEEIDDAYVIGLRGEGDFQLFVEAGNGRGTGASAFDHRTLRTTLFHRAPAPGRPPDLKVLAAPPGQVSRVVQVEATADGFAVRVVLDYLWFTPVGTPPTLGNRTAVLIDGEEAWGAVADAIEAATERVHVTTWLYQETAELRRPDPLAEPADRAGYTAHRMLQDTAGRGVTVRLLLWDAPFLDMPEGAQEAAENLTDNFEVLQEANVARGNLLRPDEYPLFSKLLGAWPLYSFHQKTVMVDGKIGFCGGMNLKENDWDAPGHTLFDPRRARFSRVADFRRKVLGRLEASDHAPRHDFMARVQGPAVAHLEENFRERWNHVRENHGEAWCGSSAVGAPPPVDVAGGSAVQVVRTMPPPYGERGILDVYLRAIGTARRLIYIEDQFFRSTHVSDAIADAVRTWPGLHVVVVTVRSYADSVLQSGWSWECFRRIQARRPDFELYSLVITEVDAGSQVHVREVDIHAKLMLVDDTFLTLGSCNINDRGFELEGEINLAIVDPALARETRLRLWREHLAHDPRLTGDIDADMLVWREHANRNRGASTEGASTVVPFVPVERNTMFDRFAW
ncbi:MAG: phosphatidylserine/phosphatidylglycerophosphate/cardiolipin synthase family protein [Pseudomonadota bacterium]|nr:phosphatidylserine/phosphatidylglycerophosphate/cardiolipin synthase family protein [Pseudomonadota bacterium]